MYAVGYVGIGRGGDAVRRRGREASCSSCFSDDAECATWPGGQAAHDWPSPSFASRQPLFPLSSLPHHLQG